MLNDDWMDLNFQQNFNDRMQTIRVIDGSRLKIGKNGLVKKFTMLNNAINYYQMNIFYNCYKLKCKEKFLKN